MRLRSAGDDVANVTSRQVRGRRRGGGGDGEVGGGVLTVVNATRRDAGLIVCYYSSSVQRSAAFHVFRLSVTDDHQPSSHGLYHAAAVSVGRLITPPPIGEPGPD